MNRSNFLIVILATSIVPCAFVAYSTVIEVQMTDFLIFFPDTVTINEGDTVLWRNVSFDIHSSTSGNPCNSDGTWDSGFMNPGNTFTRVFPIQGIIPYFCIPHCGINMFGAVIVQGVGVEEDPKTNAGISQFKLFQNKPNPFFSQTEIQFELPKPTRVKIEILNLIGQRITTLGNKDFEAGLHFFTWGGLAETGNKVSRGIYFFSIKTNEFRETKMMVYLD